MISKLQFWLGPKYRLFCAVFIPIPWHSWVLVVEPDHKRSRLLVTVQLIGQARGGILRWCDAVGAATIVDRASKYTSLGKRFEPSPLLVDIAKTGKKFYPRPAASGSPAKAG